MKKAVKKPIMTLDKLARITQKEFVSVRSEMAGEFKAVRSEMAGEFKAVRSEMAGEFKAVRSEIGEVKTDLQTEIAGVKSEVADLKEGLEDFKRDVIVTVNQSNDRVVSKLDVVLKEFAAHTHSHRRIDDTLLDHESRLKKVEVHAK